MLEIPKIKIPITEIPTGKDVRLFLKREDFIHPEISGNKFWKLYYNVENYLQKNPENPFIITFGGAFSNHIFAVSSLSKELGIPSLGIIRGEELEAKIEENFTLKSAQENAMEFRFVSREMYRDKNLLTENLKSEFPNALILPEGGTNELAVKGIQHMISDETKQFHYLCSAVGTGGTLAGISKFAEENQKVIGFSVVNDESLEDQIFQLSGKRNFELIEASENRYGKISEDEISFINRFFEDFGIMLEPIYTGKMMKKIFELIEEDFFPTGSKVLAFHTGGLQGIEGANQLLKNKNRIQINFNKND